MIEDNSTLYAAFMDSLHFKLVLDMRKDPAEWTSLSPATIPISNATNNKLAVIKGVLYLVYYRLVQPNVAYTLHYLHIKKFVGGSWVSEGSFANHRPTTYDNFDLDFDLAGVPTLSIPFYGYTIFPSYKHGIQLNFSKTKRKALQPSLHISFRTTV